MVQTRSQASASATEGGSNTLPTKPVAPSKLVKKQSRKRSYETATAAETASSKTDVNKVDEESSDGPLYFWRETHPETGWLSQWYYCPFKDDQDASKTYKTAEHYMMHHKALLFGDSVIALNVLKASHPRLVKGLGRKVANFDNALWTAKREEIVLRGNILKFTTAITEKGFQKGTAAGKDLPLIEGSLREMLLATGEREIVEASPMDRIWGVGYGAANAGDMRESWGLNLLGKALEEVRTLLREKEEQNK
ncbi:hypothetical protein G7046_g2114 [Stylonectria norvegica]|nr:hypothetical protein G7046_g2114 [Stylonectria norvegica]